MEDQQNELSLMDYLAVVRRRWLLIAATMLLTALAAWSWSATRPAMYRATTEVLISGQTFNQTLDPTASPARDVARQIENELLFAKGRAVLDALTNELGYEPTVSVTADSKTADLLSFTATGRRPHEVAAAADRYAQLFITARTARIVDSATQTRQAVMDRLTDLRARLAALDPAAVGTASQRTGLEQQIGLYEQYTNGLELIGELAAASNAQVLSAAQVPDNPYAPQPARRALLGLVVGLVAGIGVALLLEFLDDRVSSKEDLERVASSATLALIPELPKRLAGLPKRLAGDAAGPMHEGALGEAFRNLRTAVQFLGLRDPLQTLQITSSGPAEGKTTVATHLAVAMARSGTPVVLVDADLRRPSVAGRLGLADTVGLTTVMLGQADLDAAVQRVVGYPNLFVITAGPAPENAADFLWPAEHRTGTPSLAAVLQALVNRGCTVLVDSPPVLPVADALTISRSVQGTLFVAAANQSSRRDIARSLESLALVEARVVGTVFNKAHDSGSRYGYGYGYGYGSPKRRRRGWRVRRRTPTPPPMPAFTGAARRRVERDPVAAEQWGGPFGGGSQKREGIRPASLLDWTGTSRPDSARPKSDLPDDAATRPAKHDELNEHLHRHLGLHGQDDTNGSTPRGHTS